MAKQQKLDRATPGNDAAKRAQNDPDPSDDDPYDPYYAFVEHFGCLAWRIQKRKKYKGVANPNKGQKFEAWVTRTADLLGEVDKRAKQKRQDEVQEGIQASKRHSQHWTWGNLWTQVKNAATHAKKAATALETELASTTEEAVEYAATKVQKLFSEAGDEADKVENIVDVGVHSTLRIAAKLPGSLDSSKFDDLKNKAEDELRGPIAEAIKGEASRLRHLLEIFKVAHDLQKVGGDILERAEIVSHSIEDLCKSVAVEYDHDNRMTKLIDDVKEIFEGKEEEDIAENIAKLVLLVVVTVNPLADVIYSIFVGDRKALGDRLTPCLVPAGALYKWLNEVSEVMGEKRELVCPLPDRKARELAFRRMVVGALDSYIRTGHTGQSGTDMTGASTDHSAAAGTIRPVDQRAVLYGGLELVSVLVGAFLSYLFTPAGVANPVVPTLPHRAPAAPQPFDFRGDMAATAARGATQPVMSIAAVALNGFWEVSPNNRALVDAVSGLVGHMIRALCEHVLSGILHLFEIFEMYPDDQLREARYHKLVDWDTETKLDGKPLKLGVFLDLHVAYPLVDHTKDLDNELKALKEKLVDLLKPDMVLLKLLKDYAAYREAVMDFRGPRFDATVDAIEEFTLHTVEKLETASDDESESLRVEVTLNTDDVDGPSMPVVRAFVGDSAPVVLDPPKNSAQGNTYSGIVKLPPVAKLTGTKNVNVKSSQGASASKKVGSVELNFYVTQGFCGVKEGLKSSESFGTDGLATCVGIIVKLDDGRIFCGHMEHGYEPSRDDEEIKVFKDKVRCLLKKSIPCTDEWYDQAEEVFYCTSGTFRSSKLTVETIKEDLEPDGRPSPEGKTDQTCIYIIDCEVKYFNSSVQLPENGNIDSEGKANFGIYREDK